MDYQFETKASDGKETIEDLSARKKAAMDTEIQAQYKLLYDLDVLAEKVKNQEFIEKLTLDLSDHRMLHVFLQ